MKAKKPLLENRFFGTSGGIGGILAKQSDFSVLNVFFLFNQEHPPKPMEKHRGFHLQKTWFLGTKNKVFDGFGCPRNGVFSQAKQLDKFFFF